MSDLDRNQRFMRHFLPSEGRIRALVFALVPRRADADDVFQESCAVLCQKFDEFQEGTNFAAWSLRIARFQVLAYYTARRRNRARLGDDVLESVADRMAARSSSPGDYEGALDGCLLKLPEPDRRLIDLRYRHELGVDELARNAGTTVFAVYKALDRVQSRLLDCVKRRLRAEGLA
jgi:RNA polymerase sigma-70 factor (ECF subfamily)